MTKEVKSREVWWAKPPESGQSEIDVKWGYLQWYSDGSFDFVYDPKNEPSLEEIRSRKSCRFW